ncbi:hypothetical protein OAP83_00345 [Rickettsiales bacterium]|nr:hypothetical protein [Rickettsiales bacterium]
MRKYIKKFANLSFCLQPSVLLSNVSFTSSLQLNSCNDDNLTNVSIFFVVSDAKSVPLNFFPHKDDGRNICKTSLQMSETYLFFQNSWTFSHQEVPHKEFELKSEKLSLRQQNLGINDCEFLEGYSEKDKYYRFHTHTHDDKFLVSVSDGVFCSAKEINYNLEKNFNISKSKTDHVFKLKPDYLSDKTLRCNENRKAFPFRSNTFHGRIKPLSLSTGESIDNDVYVTSTYFETASKKDFSFLLSSLINLFVTQDSDYDFVKSNDYLLFDILSKNIEKIDNSQLKSYIKSISESSLFVNNIDIINYINTNDILIPSTYLTHTERLSLDTQKAIILS